jgi:hypothetical protein
MASQTKTSYPPDFWLVVAERDGRVFTVGDDAAPAIFSGEGEAEMFRYLGVGEDGWLVRRTSPAELVSLLEGPCAGAEKVALDPSPEMFVERLVGLVSTGKVRFLERFVKQDRGPGLPAAS